MMCMIKPETQWNTVELAMKQKQLICIGSKCFITFIVICECKMYHNNLSFL